MILIMMITMNIGDPEGMQNQTFLSLGKINNIVQQGHPCDNDNKYMEFGFESQAG